jgi:predicted HD superfamily hydrolase involved in NAD metabolism
MDNKKNLELINIQNKLRKKLSEYRFYHSIGVQYTAAALAMRYGVNIYEASVAGILHDCAKYLSDEEILAKCQKHGIAITEEECNQPQLLHGKLGAHFAKAKYGIEDENILDAIRYHTTGTPNMTTIQKIIFLADYIEPNRKEVTGLNEIRTAAFEDLDKAVVLKIKNTKKYLYKKDIQLKGLSYETYKFYVKDAEEQEEFTEEIKNEMFEGLEDFVD